MDRELNEVLNLNCEARDLVFGRKAALVRMHKMINDKGWSGNVEMYKRLLTHYRENQENKEQYVGILINWLNFVDILQQELIRAEVLPSDYDFEAHKELVAMQPGDVPVTYALERDFGFKPDTNLRTGLRRFAQWYKEFYRV